MRPALLLIGLALAGCAATDSPGDVVMTTPGPQATASPPAAAPAPAAAPSAPARTPRATRGNVAPQPAPAPETPAVAEEPMTRERASQICWGKYDDGRRKLSLDQRAELVDQCVRATMRGEKVK